MAVQQAKERREVSIKDSLLAQLAKLKITVDQLDEATDWKHWLETNQKEAQKCHRRVAKQANTINEKSKAITALERLYNASENRLLQEREASKEALQEEQRAGRELLSRWTQEKDDMQRKIEF